MNITGRGYRDKDNKMKILLINVVCGIRSTGRICTDLAKKLEEEGHTVRIAYGREFLPPQYEKYAYRITKDYEVKLDALRSRIFDNAGFNNALATKKFVEWIKEYDPDVIHLHNIHGYYLNVKILFEYLRSCNKRIVWTMHDCWPFTGHSALCDGIGCKKWITGCHNCEQKHEYPKALIDRSSRNWTLKKAVFSNVSRLTVVTPSKWLSDQVKKSFLSGYDINVIPNGINTKIFCHQESDLKKRYNIVDKKILLSAATTWNDLKGYQDFIKLSGMIGSEYVIVLVGVSEKQKSELPGNIIGIPRTADQTEMAQWYSAANVYVNLTYCDTYPTVNVESIACGTPVITYKTGGSVESMFGYGKVVPRGDIDAVYKEIMDIGNNEWNSVPLEKLDNSYYINKYYDLLTSM